MQVLNGLIITIRPSVETLVVSHFWYFVARYFIVFTNGARKKKLMSSWMCEILNGYDLLKSNFVVKPTCKARRWGLSNLHK